MDTEDEDTPVVGGEGFTPEELAQAEQNLTAQLVRMLFPPAFACCNMSTATAAAYV